MSTVSIRVKQKRNSTIKILKKEGVPQGAIILEDRALNTGQNVSLGMAAIKAAGHNAKKLVLVGRSFLSLRSVLTFAQQFPEVVTVSCSDPETLEEYLTAVPGEGFG